VHSPFLPTCAKEVPRDSEIGECRPAVRAILKHDKTRSAIADAMNANTINADFARADYQPAKVTRALDDIAGLSDDVHCLPFRQLRWRGSMLEASRRLTRAPGGNDLSRSLPATFARMTWARLGVPLPGH
jgi:hypothetical protein